MIHAMPPMWRALGLIGSALMCGWAFRKKDTRQIAMYAFFALSFSTYP